MIVKRAGSAFLVWTPAKLNLFLEVLKRRDDGYHEIETLMSPIAWRDTLYLRANSTGRIAFDCRWTHGLEARRNCRRLPPACRAYAELPPAEQNLAYRAAVLLREEAGLKQGAEIRLRKRIPAAAGLGGASSDAAAALVAANLAWKLGWPLERLAETAARLGSDIPFFLLGKSAICRGRGERLEPLDWAASGCYVVVKPAAGLSTAAVYGACRPPEHPRSVDSLRQALQAGRAGGELPYFNRLTEAAQSELPGLAELGESLRAVSGRPGQMSGSGTSHFVPCRNAQHARRVAALARMRGLGAVCCSVSAKRHTSQG